MLLQRVQMVWCAQALDGDDLGLQLAGEQ